MLPFNITSFEKESHQVQLDEHEEKKRQELSNAELFKDNIEIISNEEFLNKDVTQFNQKFDEQTNQFKRLVSA